MADLRKKLADLFASPAKRLSHFGSTITRIDLRLIRCHTQTTIDIVNPITAFSGLNGCGKSTILQLAAAAYDSDSPYKVTDFIRRTQFDDPPVAEGGAATFTVQEDRQKSKSVSLSYDAINQRWNGYRSRLRRTAYFAGVGFFLPRSERQDFVFRQSTRMTCGAESEINAASRNWATKILSSRYDKVVSTEVQNGRSHDTVFQAYRGGFKYSEAQMGCGEARIHYLIQKLEQVPEKSLILLEEPENCLHPSAQYALGTYLLDLVNRKGHQVFISTHAEALMRSLSLDSLVYLHKGATGITAIPGLTAMQAKSLLTDGYEKALTVFVEDHAARLLLTELLGLYRPELLKTIDIVVHGVFDANGGVSESGKESIKRTMKVLRDTGLRVAAVLDGDDKEDPANFVFKLPGTLPPEKELLECSKVHALLESQYSLEPHQLQQELADVDCHRFFSIIGEKTSRDPQILIAEASRAYAGTVPTSYTQSLISQLTDATH